MQPLDITRLEPAAFRSRAACLGGQLVTVVNIIEELLPGMAWYVADVQTIGPSPVHRRMPIPVHVGQARVLIDAAQRVSQFESGVFVGTPASIQRPVFRAGGLWTDDEVGAELGDGAVEIRAFDTAYWSVATAMPNLAQIVRERVAAASDIGG